MHSHVFVAGTFDQLHKGHEAILLRAFELGDQVTIGLTSDDFVLKFRADQNIAPFAKRKQQLLDFISSHDFENRSDLIAIDDPYEPAASMGDIDVLLVTKDNKVRGEDINRKRQEKGLPPVSLEEVALVQAEDKGNISGTRIRNGEIDSNGHLILPVALRPELTKPLGRVLTGDAIGSSIEAHRTNTIIAVGDVTTNTILTAGVHPNFIVVDNLVARKPYEEVKGRLKELSVYKVTHKSGPGFIAKEAVETIKKWTKHPIEKMILIIEGEEDLLTLPIVAYGPDQAVVYYGQPDEGLVEVVIDEKKRREAIALLSQFVVK